MPLTNHNWVSTLEQALPIFGHRNWIVIADSAYPAQTATGIQVVTTDADEAAVLNGVLHRIDAAPHVRPIIHIDSELDVLSEDDAPGVEEYRTRVFELLEGREIMRTPHDEILKLIGAAGESFQILVIKTGMIIPYTSIFIELDCGYWSAEAEKRLRDRIALTSR